MWGRIVENGKAYSRAVRAHMLVDTALYAQLLSSAYDRPWIFMHHDTNNNADNTFFFKWLNVPKSQSFTCGRISEDRLCAATLETEP